ncbi:hypothetical protein ACRAWD_14030 [Caulobacter segnis]
MEDVTAEPHLPDRLVALRRMNKVYAEYFPGDKPARYVSAAW